MSVTVILLNFVSETDSESVILFSFQLQVSIACYHLIIVGIPYQVTTMCIYLCILQVNTVHNAFHGTSHSVMYTIKSACDTSTNSFRSIQTQLARCDMKSDNGGWLVIFRRDKNLDASSYVDFGRTWVDYEAGFGDLETEFWYGLREMHCLTQEDVNMRLDITYTNGTSIVWTYGLFKVDGTETNYTLHVGQAVGSPGTHIHGDAMNYHNELPFSTKDRDNDAHSGINCATHSPFLGGWWWNNCGSAKLTRPHSSGVQWSYTSKNPIVSFVEMKIRPKSCQESCS